MKTWRSVLYSDRFESDSWEVWHCLLFLTRGDLGNRVIQHILLGKVYNCLISFVNQRKHSNEQNNIQEVFQNKIVCYSFFLEDVGTKH